MKFGTAVFGAHVAVICVLGLTQGCVTTESKGTGRGAAARHKSPWGHTHRLDRKADGGVENDYLAGSGSDDMIEMEPVAQTGSTPSTRPTSRPMTSSRPKPSSGNTSIYVVQKGDTLSEIASDHGSTTSELVSLNGLSNPDSIFEGQELAVPSRGRSSGSSSSKRSSSGTGGEYIIQPGDTLSQIALDHNVSMEAIRKANGLSDDRIVAGDGLTIPGYTKGSSSSRRTSSTKSSVTRKSTPKPSTPKPAPTPAPVPAPTAPAAPDSSITVDAVIDHIVYPGETLDDIARTYGVSKTDIMKLNGISDASSVKEHQRLRIPITE